MELLINSLAEAEGEGRVFSVLVVMVLPNPRYLYGRKVFERPAPDQFITRELGIIASLGFDWGGALVIDMIRVEIENESRVQSHTESKIKEEPIDEMQ